MSTIPADVKKEENIAEYIIHMYQTEDLILTYSFNLNGINEYVIKHMSEEEQVRKKILLWYADVIQRMQEEGISDSSKRLSATQAYVDELTRIHNNLLNTDNAYSSLYSEAEKDIKQHISLSGNTITNPIQICINGLYGMLLLKLNGKKITGQDEVKLKKFGAVLGYLSIQYKK